MQKQTPAYIDYSVSTLLIAICATFLWESWDLPPGTFEPLGSGPIPQAICLIVIMLNLYVIFRAWRRNAPMNDRSEEGVEPPNLMNAVIVLAALIIYILVMAFHLVPFWLATILMVFGIIAILSKFNRKSMLIGALIAVIMGVGSQYIFTQIFFVDLPGT